MASPGLGSFVVFSIAVVLIVFMLGSFYSALSTLVDLRQAEATAARQYVYAWGMPVGSTGLVVVENRGGVEVEVVELVVTASVKVGGREDVVVHRLDPPGAMAPGEKRVILVDFQRVLEDQAGTSLPPVEVLQLGAEVVAGDRVFSYPALSSEGAVAGAVAKAGDSVAGFNFTLPDGTWFSLDPRELSLCMAVAPDGSFSYRGYLKLSSTDFQAVNLSYGAWGAQVEISEALGNVTCTVRGDPAPAGTVLYYLRGIAAVAQPSPTYDIAAVVVPGGWPLTVARAGFPKGVTPEHGRFLGPWLIPPAGTRVVGLGAQHTQNLMVFTWAETPVPSGATSFSFTFKDGVHVPRLIYPIVFLLLPAPLAASG